MEIMKASDVAKEDLNTLVDTNQSVDIEKLLQAGYVIKQTDRFEGCFVLENKDQRTLWLRQMYITKGSVTSLPGLLEAVLALARELEAENVVIHSHHTTLDIILEALQFYPQTDPSIVDNPVDISGRWWMYNVS